MIVQDAPSLMISRLASFAHGDACHAEDTSKLIRLQQKPSDDETRNPIATYLELNDLLLRKTEVHVVGIFQIEGTLMELRDGFVCVQHHSLLVHLANHLQPAHRNVTLPYSTVLQLLVLDFTRRGRVIPVTVHTSLMVEP